MDEPTWERKQILREQKLQICKHISIVCDFRKQCYKGKEIL